MTSSKISDAGLKHLKNLRGLQRLEMSYAVTALTDAGMAEIGTLKSLVTLQLPFTNSITDAGLLHLKGLTDLRHLRLGGSAVTAKGIASLEDLPSLEAVSIIGARINDDGLRSLSKFKKLGWLSLPPQPGNFSHTELLALKKARPTLEYRAGAAEPSSPNFYQLPDPFERRWSP